MATPQMKLLSRAVDIPDYVSPEVGADGRATIRLFHPGARSVWCEGEWADWAPLEMQRDATGIWTCATEPLPPDLYEYRLYADGAVVIDSQNPATKNRFTSFLRVGTGAAFDVRDVPHGVVHTHWYHSAVTGCARRMRVYTPPGYKAQREYPVLYLLHGAGDDDESWVRTGRLNFILDNLLAEARVTPMVVAMPDGHVLGRDWKQDREAKLSAFSRDFYEGIMPQTEQHYRVCRNRERKAIAGLSMGGGQAISAALTRPEMFGAYGIFSSGLWHEITPLLEGALPELRDKPPAVLWLGIGRRDFLYGHCALLRQMLDGAQIPFSYHEDDTVHGWRAWRDYLERFAPLLFR